MSYEADQLAEFCEREYEKLLFMDKVDKIDELIDMIDVGDIDIDEILEHFEEEIFKYYSRFYKGFVE